MADALEARGDLAHCTDQFDDFSGVPQLKAIMLSYGSLISPTAALVNGVMAVVVAGFFTDRLAARIAVAATVGILCVAAVGAMLYRQHQIIEAASGETTRNKEIRVGIGAFITQANALMDECADPKSSPPTEEALDWAKRAEGFLAGRFGNSYVVRFRDPNGIPAVMLSDAALDAIHQEVWYGLYFRAFRLQQIVQQKY